MNDVIRSLKERRSVRAYREEQVREEDLRQILEAATYAPSGMGKQSAVMVVVQDKETIAKLSKLNAAVMGAEIDPFYGAPTVGVDSCWIHRAREVFEGEEGQALLKQWGIEGDYVGVGHCILGYRAGDLPEAKPRKANYIYRV